MLQSMVKYLQQEKERNESFKMKQYILLFFFTIEGKYIMFQFPLL